MEKRLFRLTWNENNWETPMQRPHNVLKADDQNIAFEKRFGYGGEDWLFNPRYQHDGYQYGYIRGINDLSETIEFINEAYLFSIKPDTKDRLLIAYIKDLEIIEGYDEILKHIIPLFRKHKKQSILELREVGAYTKGYEDNHLAPNVRFKLENIVHFGYDKVINGIKGNRFNRFKPFIIDSELEKLININEMKFNGFVFKPGKAKLKAPSKRKESLKELDINNRHTEISEALYKHLVEKSNTDKNYISIEKTLVNRKIIDLVVKKGNKYVLFEIKTHIEARAGIREAIGQLLEYALSDPSIKVESINIVCPGKLTSADAELLKQLNKIISIPIYYWEYFFNPDKSGKRFQKH